MSAQHFGSAVLLCATALTAYSCGYANKELQPGASRVSSDAAVTTASENDASVGTRAKEKTGSQVDMDAASDRQSGSGSGSASEVSSGSEPLGDSGTGRSSAVVADGAAAATNEMGAQGGSTSEEDAASGASSTNRQMDESTSAGAGGVGGAGAATLDATGGKAGAESAGGSMTGGEAGKPPDTESMGGTASVVAGGAGGSSGSGATTSGGAGGSMMSEVVDPSRRVVVVGDLHADIGVMRQVFQLAGATDENDEWVGRGLTIVQLGDLIGRSDDDRQVLDFMFDIREKAEAGGGHVYGLIGNHEIMGGRVDNQAVGLNPFPGFADLEDLDVDDPRLQNLAVAQRPRGAALMAGGPYAKKLAAFPTVLQLGGTVFVHGGVVPRWATYGIDKINEEVSEWLRGNAAEPVASLGVDNGDTVMWTRQFSSAVDEADCAALQESLSILGATRMIVAHTVHSQITPRCDDQVWAIDVGMSRAYGGAISILEIVDDKVLRVLQP